MRAKAVDNGDMKLRKRGLLLKGIIIQRETDINKCNKV